MKKKGFTLIELLAVIAILAILVILAVPKVLQLFEEAKKNTFKIEAQNLIKAAEQGYTLGVLKGNVEDSIFIYENGVETKTGNIQLNMSGRKIQNGTINITKTRQIEMAIYDGKYCANKDFELDEVVIEEKPLEECVVGSAFVCGETFIDTRDSNEYETLLIGEQCWFKENLRYTGNGCLTNTWNNVAFHDACLSHNSSWGLEVLYQWGAAMDGSTISGSQGLCPEGWYVPTQDDFTVLSDFLQTDPGTKLKSQSPLWDGNNESDFSAMPAGYRLPDAGAKMFEGTYGFWWTSTLVAPSSRYYYLTTGSSSFSRNVSSHPTGYSVRCILAQ